MITRTRLGTLIFLFVVARSASAKVRTPKPGSVERRAILDAVRKPYEKYVKEKTVFYDVAIRISGDWAYAQGDGRNINGGALKFWSPIADPTMVATLKKRRGRWTVVYWGASSGEDAFYEAVKGSKGAPRELFPPERLSSYEAEKGRYRE